MELYDLLRLAGLVICAAVVVDLLRRYSAGYAILASLGCCIVLLYGALVRLQPVFQELYLLAQQLNAQGLSVVFRAVLIALLAQAVQDLCREAGQPALAGRVDFVARVMMLTMALPMLKQLVGVLNHLLGFG